MLPIWLPPDYSSAFTRRLYFGRGGWICTVLAPRILIPWHVFWIVLFGGLSLVGL